MSILGAGTYAAGVRELVAAADITAVTIKMMLLDGSYAFDPYAHTVRDDVAGELVGIGYTAGGVALTGFGMTTVDTPSSLVLILADPVDFGTVTLVGVEQAVTYIDTGDSSTDVLLSWLTMDSESPVAESFIVGLPTIDMAGTALVGLQYGASIYVGP